MLICSVAGAEQRDTPSLLHMNIVHLSHAHDVIVRLQSTASWCKVHTL